MKNVSGSTPKNDLPNFLHNLPSISYRRMGIRNLTRWIQWMGCMRPTAWDILRGQRVGVDILSILYKARAEAQPILQVIHRIVVGLREHEIIPVFIFDGRRPREKQGVCAARQRQKVWKSEDEQEHIHVSSDDRNEVKQLLYALGVLSLNAEQEADAALAYLSRRGDLAAVITSDMDFLPRGIQHIIVPQKLAELPTWKSIHLAEVLQTSQISYDQFVEMCVLMGCDYAPNIPTLSYQSAYWRIRRAGMLEVLEAEGIRTPTLWITAVRLLKGADDLWETLLAEKQREKWANGPPPAEPDATILLKAT